MKVAIEDILNPIADMAQCSFGFNAKTQVISGRKDVKIDLMDKASIIMRVQVVSSFINSKTQQAGVLLHIGGNLYLLIAHNKKADTVSAYIISRAMLGVKPKQLVDYLPRTCNIKTAVGKLVKGVKKAYMKNSQEHDWEEFDIGITAKEDD